MAESTLAKVTAKTAAEVSKHAELSEEAGKLLDNQQTPSQFFDLLMAKQLFADACRLLAHALPKREAVWWACGCAVQVDGLPSPPAKAALQQAETWVRQPTENHRRPLLDAAEAAGIGTPAGAAALGGFVSGGSLAPPDQVPVPPPEYLTGVAVANAVILAAMLGDAAKIEERFRKFLALGIDIANGANRWKEPEPTPGTVKRPRTTA